MDLFRERAAEILDLAKVGRAESVTVLFHDNGPGLPPGLHLIMDEARAAAPWRSQDTTTAVYQVTRAGGTVLVQARQGTRSCELQGKVAPRLLQPLLLNNQALYRLEATPALSARSLAV